MTLPPAVAICWRLSDRRHSKLSRHRIAEVRLKHIALLLSPVRSPNWNSRWSLFPSWSHQHLIAALSYVASSGRTPKGFRALSFFQILPLTPVIIFVSSTPTHLSFSRFYFLSTVLILFKCSGGMMHYFWCIYIYIYLRFGGASCLHFPGRNTHL